MEILFNTYYRQGRWIAHRVKEGDMEAIRLAAERMAPLVPEGSALVPIPSRLGYATATLLLAEEISRLTGAPVADILKGESRASNYESKKQGHPLKVEDLGFRKVGDTDLTPCFVDNVCDTGVTMASAFLALKRGVGLVFAMTKNGRRLGDAQLGQKEREPATA